MPADYICRTCGKLQRPRGVQPLRCKHCGIVFGRDGGLLIIDMVGTAGKVSVEGKDYGKH